MSRLLNTLVVLSALVGALGCELVLVDETNKPPTAMRLDGSPGVDARAQDADVPCNAMCDERCVDLGSNRDHCGQCGRACPSGQICRQAMCAETGLCEDGLTDCDGECVRLSDNNQHCGGCNTPCAGACGGGECGGAPYRLRAITQEHIPVSGAGGGGCETEMRGSSGELEAVNTPLTTTDSDSVARFSMQYSMDTFLGEPTRLAVYAWEGSGSLATVLWAAEVTVPGGALQYTVGERPVYATFPGGTIGDPFEGYGTDATASPDWDETFVTVNEAGAPSFIAEADARAIYDSCFELRNLQVIQLDNNPVYVE